jgi:hypothetical protein
MKTVQTTVDRRMRSLTIGAVLLCLAVKASANLIINGNFESGNTGFSSDYTYIAVPQQWGPNGSWDPGTYAIDTNPNNDHGLWASFGDHTTGHGKMMVVNGSTEANKAVWADTLSLAAGTYHFSAWAANTYAASPASLQFSIDGGSPMTFNLPANETGVWHQFTYTFTVPNPQTISIVDLNLAYSGNDFALDDISLTVPDGGTTVVLLGMGMLALAWTRRKIHRTA